jgi:ClpP class serine protease
MVATQRGDKLRIPLEEVGQAKVYSGAEAVKLGLVDAMGGETDAIKKAASLAGISSYDLVDVNVEVFRMFNQQIRRIIDPLLVGAGGASTFADIRTLMALSAETGDADDAFGGVTSVEMLRRQFLPSGLGAAQEEVLPGFPLTVNPPNVYYLYVGPSP